jgi:hypothetical protein
MALGWKRQTPPWVRCVSWGLSCSATTHTLDSGDYGATRVVRHLSRIRANTQSESGFSFKHVWSNRIRLGALSDAVVGLQLIRLINVEILRNALSFHPHSTAFTARHGDPVRPKNTNCGGGESLAILPRVLKRLVLLLLWHSSLVCVHRTPIYERIDYVFTLRRPLIVSFLHAAQPHCASASHPLRHTRAASPDR